MTEPTPAGAEPPEPPSPPARPPASFRKRLLFVVLASLAIRLYGLFWDGDHFYHPDERRIAEAVAQLSYAPPLQLHPHFFAYGSFPFYVTRAVTTALGAAVPRLGGYDGAVWAGRALSALWGTAAVLLLGLLGRRLLGERGGLLAALLLGGAVLHAQNSHFGTNDVPLATLVLAALFALVRVAEEGRARHYALAGLLIGLAAATKVSALPLFLPLAVATFFDGRSRGRFGRALGLGAGAGLISLLAFALGEPYALLDAKAFFADVSEQSRMVRNAGIVPYTNQYLGTTNYLYELEQMAWGLGPLLLLAALWGTWKGARHALRERSAPELVLLSFAVPFFLVTGAFDVKFPRYLLPIYPVVLLFAARSLDGFAERFGRGKKLAELPRRAVLAATLLYLLAFLSIYARPHSIVTASEWVYDHLAPGSRLLVQDWDEGFPFHLPPERKPERFRVRSFPYYEPDDPAKTEKLARELAEHDYVVLQTKRIYGAVTRAPKKFPATNRYFELLFAGDLGYTLLHAVDSRPSLLGLSVPTELADESLSVYDHPKFVIFENTGRLDAKELARRLRDETPSRKVTRRDMLLAHPRSGESAAALPTPGPRPTPSPPLSTSPSPSPDAATPAQGGESAFGATIRGTVPATLATALLLELLGLAGYALLRRAFPRTVGLYALGKVVGVLVFAYLAWLASSVGLAPFSKGPLRALVAALLLAAALSHARRRGRDVDAAGRRERLATEAAFWGTFAVFLALRALNPEIVWGEKPMDFAFLNALFRSTAMPPPEPWFAGAPLSYTYFGHFTVAALGKTLGVHPALAFNLGIAAFAALVSAALFALGSFLGARARVGGAVVLLALFSGNLSGLRELLARKSVDFDYAWATSRVIPPNAVNEYPFWSFLFADLHAHVMAFAWGATLLAVAVFSITRRPRGEAFGRGGGGVLVALLALALGAVSVTSGWSLPFHACLLGALALFAVRHRALTFAEALLGLAGTGLGAWLLFRPFWARFTPPPRQFGLERGPFAPPARVFEVLGLFLVVLLPFLFVALRRAIAPDRPLRPFERLGFAALGVALLLTVVSFDRYRPVESIRNFAALSALLGLAVALHPRTPPRHRLAAVLAGYGFAVVAGCEVFYVWDRMNTIFKFYLEAWFVFAAASAVVAVDLFRESDDLSLRPALKLAWRSATVSAAALATLTLTTTAVGMLRPRRAPDGPVGTLDGMAYLKATDPYERAAYDWVERNVPGIPTLVEAWGPSYGGYARVSMNTGLPIVLGWDYHVLQRGCPQGAIDSRKLDVQAIYGATSEEAVREALARTRVALVWVGAHERNLHGAAVAERLAGFPALLQPIYKNAGVTLFAVRGVFSREAPPTTVEDVRVETPPSAPAVEVPPAAHAQEPPGTFSQPRGLATAPDGSVYVADFGNNRIQKLTAELESVAAWGDRGNAPGEFQDPCALAVAPDGTLFVADTWNGRVQLFDASGKHLLSFTAELFGPRGIALGKDGTVYVCDTGNARVVATSRDGASRFHFGRAGTEAGRLKDPMGIAVDREGRVLVADVGNGRLSVFDAAGAYVSAFPVEGWRSGVFSEPHVAAAADGTIWLTVPLAGEVRAYDPAGKLLRTLRKPADGDLFVRPLGLALSADGTTLYVSDAENGRVVKIPLGDRPRPRGR